MRPDRGDGPFGGGATGLGHDRDPFDDALPMRSRYSPDIQASRTPTAPPTQPMQPMPATAGPSRAASPMRGGMSGSPPPGMNMFREPREAAPGGMPMDPASGHTSAGAAAAGPYSGWPSAHTNVRGGVMPPYGLSAFMDEGGASASATDAASRPNLGGKTVSFNPEARLGRTREDEELRGEAEAGAQPEPKDIK